MATDLERGLAPVRELETLQAEVRRLTTRINDAIAADRRTGMERRQWGRGAPDRRRPADLAAQPGAVGPPRDFARVSSEELQATTLALQQVIERCVALQRAVAEALAARGETAAALNGLQPGDQPGLANQT